MKRIITGGLLGLMLVVGLTPALSHAQTVTPDNQEQVVVLETQLLSLMQQLLVLLQNQPSQQVTNNVTQPIISNVTQVIVDEAPVPSFNFGEQTCQGDTPTIPFEFQNVGYNDFTITFTEPPLLNGYQNKSAYSYGRRDTAIVMAPGTYTYHVVAGSFEATGSITINSCHA